MSFAFAAAAPKSNDDKLVDLSTVLGELRRGGLVIYFRHGVTDRSGATDEEADLEKCDTQRNLSAEGREQQGQVGKSLHALKIPLGTVLTSPFCRCKETATLVSGRYAVEGSLASSVGADKAETLRGAGVLRRMLMIAPSAGTNTVLVSHSANLRDATGFWVKEGEALVFRPGTAGNPQAIARILGGWSLRRRFMAAPLLGLLVCIAITAAFVYESRSQNELLVRVTERDLKAFNRYAEVFVDLTEEHTALYDLLNSAGKSDEGTVYDRAKAHLYKVQTAVRELEQTLPSASEGVITDAVALRNELAASAKAYRSGVGAAVGMTTVSVALAPEHIALANERFTVMNRYFVRFLEMKRLAITAEIAARVRSNQIGNTTIAFIGVSMAALLFFFSQLLSRMLCRSIETQIGILTELGTQAGAPPVVGGNDEVDRMSRVVAAFRQALLANTALTTDLTEMKRVDRMKNEFVSMVSHELRTPLTSIRGSLGLLAGGVAGALPDAAKKLVEIAKSNSERLIRLINDILDTEKIESGQMRLDLKVVDVRTLVKQTITANEGFAAQHHVSLALRGAEGALFVNVDADRLVQALTNLLSNAIKFSPARGAAEVILSHGAGCVRVEVRDQGPGIPEEFRARIFQKFSQADSSDTRQKGGSGLGLNITKAIVERLGGTIGFASEAGAGTSFFLELPEWRDRGISKAVLPKSPMAAIPNRAQSVI
jgi:signal transduction histidine kinase/phosphohistidine phosphatase SixA